MLAVLLSPVAWGIAWSAVLLLSWRHLRRRWRVAGLLGAALLLVMCMPLGANALVAFVESRAPAAAYCAPPVSARRLAAAGARGGRATAPLVLLSGGFERTPRAIDDYAALTGESWRRLRAAVDWWKRDRDGALWIVGGGPHAVTEAAMQQRLALDWGVAPAALHIEQGSTTTWEGAQAMRGLLDDPIRLATSAIHLPRAQVAFVAAGYSPCLLATDSDYLPFSGIGYLLPQASAIQKTQDAAYELLGLLVYRWRAHQAGVPKAR